MPVELRVLLDLPVHKVQTNSSERQLVVDLWLPQGTRSLNGVREPIPLVIYIHGGGWKMGTHYRPPFQPRLFDNGIGQAAITYRFSGEAPFPACLYDCKLMVRWLRAHTSEYGLDPQRFVGWGISAGGHLVSLMAATQDLPEWEGNGPHLDQSSALSAVVNWCGPSDLWLHFIETSQDPEVLPMVTALLGGPGAHLEERARRASSTTYVRPGCPPHLLVYGEQDKMVPLAHGLALRDALQAAGSPVELVIVPGAGHSLEGPMSYTATREFLLRQLI